MSDLGRFTKNYALGWPAVLAGLVLIAFAATAYALQTYERHVFDRLMAERATALKAHIETALAHRLHVVERMGQRWEAAAGTPEEQWREDVSHHVDQVKGLRSIAWVDDTYHVRWIEPLVGNEQAMGLKIPFGENRVEALQQAVGRHEMLLSAPTDLLQGYKAFLAFWPIQIRGRFDGFMVGVFASDALLQDITQADAPEFSISLRSDTDVFFRHELPPDTVDTHFSGRATIDISGQRWTLVMTPSRQFLAGRKSWLGPWVVGLGALVSGLLFVCVRSATLANRRTKALQESNRVNDAILSGAANIIVATDAQGLVTAWNKAAETLLGYKPEEVIGRHTPLLWHPPEEALSRAASLSEQLGRPIEPSFRAFVADLDTQRTNRSERTFVRKDGSRFPVDLTTCALRDEDGKINGYLGIATDITAQREMDLERQRAAAALELSEARHRMLINGVADYAIYWLDPQGRVSSWNTGAQNLKQYTGDEVIGKHFSVFFTDEDRRANLPSIILHEAATQGRFATEGWRMRKDGTRFWANVLVEPIRSADGALVGYAKISRDDSLRRAYEQRLKDTVQELNAVLATMVDGLIIIDHENKIQTFTPVAERIFGYRSEEVRGKPVQLLMPSPQREEHDRYVRNYNESGRAKIIGIGREVVAQRKDGSTFPMELGISAFNLGDKKRFVGVVRDITERKLAEESLKTSEETFRAAMESASIGMTLVTPTGRFLKVNNALCSLLGYSETELLGMDFQDITHPEDLERDLDLVRQTLDGTLHRYRLEKRYVHKSGRVVWTLLSVSLVRDSAGSPRFFVSQIQDISEQKEVERLKNDFISSVSHELRTPLTSIRGALGLIVGALSSDLSDKVKNLLNVAHKNSERLIVLINDILDLEKITAGQMRFEEKEATLHEAVSHTVESLDGYAQKFGVRLEVIPFEAPLKIKVDEDRFVQALSNLISNAIKFSPTGGSVTVTAQAVDGRARIEVMDRGPGIPDEFRQRIFQRFSQADGSSTRRSGGTGLGLYITKQIVERMGGTIGFDSTVGAGSTFWLEFPLYRDPVTTPESGPDPFGDTSVLAPRYAVLHVEDDRDLSNVVASSLKDHVKVTSATSIAEARQLIQEESFSLVILDLALPDGSGLELLEALEKAHLPVVILCADAPPPDVARRVAAVLVKTKQSERMLVETVLDQLSRAKTAA